MLQTRRPSSLTYSACTFLKALSNFQVMQAAASCSGLCRAAKELPPRVLIVDSQAAKFLEANFVSGASPLHWLCGTNDTRVAHRLHSCPKRPPEPAGKMHEVGKAYRGRYSKTQWPTGAAISPYNGDIFVSSYQVLAGLRSRQSPSARSHPCRTFSMFNVQQCRMQACCVSALAA